MVEKIRTINRDLFMRRCLACGYDGDLLQGGAAERCALCGCDLLLRPARSYAEMEGLTSRPIILHESAEVVPVRDMHVVIQQWLTFVVLMLAGLALLVYLGREALP